MIGTSPQASKGRDAELGASAATHPQDVFGGWGRLRGWPSQAPQTPATLPRRPRVPPQRVERGEAASRAYEDRREPALWRRYRPRGSEQACVERDSLKGMVPATGLSRGLHRAAYGASSSKEGSCRPKFIPAKLLPYMTGIESGMGVRVA